MDQKYDAGVAEGIAKYCKEGCEEEKFALARSMKANGLNLELISSLTGLSLETLQSEF
ncbi:hypothetical protein [Candidatus Bealeia paramacronuclearis]|uniref:hypothetical protein n=1 Tax=Candidatus Bealeia paramacronuclearis TaxID=1921001 RepID=UPI002F269041